MAKENNEPPFKRLGASLKRLRVRRQESLAEVSGAVEIDVDVLSTFEAGANRPSEDILMLLINHFSMGDKEAATMWKLAGYDPAELEQEPDYSRDDSSNHQAPTMMVMPMDVRVVYTDMVHVAVNDFGLVMNFLQTAGPANKPLAIARVGMSREHAKSVLDVLQRTLAQSEPRRLPAPKTKQQEEDTSQNQA